MYIFCRVLVKTQNATMKPIHMHTSPLYCFLKEGKQMKHELEDHI